MPTNKNRVAGYLSDDIHKCFQAFANDRGLSESKAITLILSEYFGVGQNIAHQVDHQTVTREEFDELLEKVDQLGSLLHEQSESKSKPKSKPKRDSKSESLDGVTCKFCGSLNFAKAGRTQHGKQRYQCNDCEKHFSV